MTKCIQVALFFIYKAASIDHESDFIMVPFFLELVYLSMLFIVQYRSEGMITLTNRQTSNGRNAIGPRLGLFENNHV